MFERMILSNNVKYVNRSDAYGKAKACISCIFYGTFNVVLCHMCCHGRGYNPWNGVCCGKTVQGTQVKERIRRNIYHNEMKSKCLRE